MQFIGGVQHGGGMSWQHFCCPDGTVLEIIEPGTAPAPSPAADIGTADRTDDIDPGSILALAGGDSLYPDRQPG